MGRQEGSCFVVKRNIECKERPGRHRSRKGILLSVTDDIGTVSEVPLDGFELPPALQTDGDNSNVGECKSCGVPVFRPVGQSPTGRKLRIPKYCDGCKKSKPTQASPGRRRKSTNPDIEEGMTALYTSLGFLLLPVDQALGVSIIGEERLTSMLGQAQGPQPSVAEACGKAWAHVAASNPKVADVLGPLVKTTVWSELWMAHTPIAGHVIAKRPKIRIRFAQRFSQRLRFRRRRVPTSGVSDGE